MQQLAWMAKRPSSYGQFGDGVVGVVVEMRPMSDKKTGHSEEVLGEEWEEFIDAAGNKYYRNTQTDERSRERPMRRLQSSSVLDKVRRSSVMAHRPRSHSRYFRFAVIACCCVAVLVGGIFGALVLTGTLSWESVWQAFGVEEAQKLHALPNRHRFEGCDGSVGCELLREPYKDSAVSASADQ